MTNSSSSLARDLVVRLVVGLTILSLLTFAAIYAFVHHRYTRQFDAGLIAKSRALASLVHLAADGHLEFEFSDELMPEFERKSDHQYFQIWRPDGRTLEKSRSLEKQELPKFYGTIESPVIRDIELGPRGATRAAGVQFIPELTDDLEEAVESGKHPAPDPIILVVAEGAKKLRTTLNTLLLAGLLGAIILPVGAAFIVAAGVRRGLRPVNQLSETVAAIGTDTLDTRVELASLPRELQPIQAQINALLDRLSGAFSRERRFTSAVSHELKTPIAEAMATLSVARNWNDDQALQSQSRDNALEVLQKMQRLVETLLTLTRSTEGSDELQQQPTDSCVILLRCINSVEPTARDRQLVLRPQGIESPLLLVTNELLLESIFSNILRNAVQYAPEGTEIQLALELSDGSMTFECTNQAPGLEESDAQRLLEPFWRKDESRTGSSGEHFGLGLAIASAFCARLAGELTADINPNAELTIRVKLPAKSDAS